MTATFAGCRPVTDLADLDRTRPDVAVIGAPFDLAVTNRPGARFGPAALRSTAYHSGSHHIDLGVDVFDRLDAVDVGDARCPHGNTAAAHTNIHALVSEVAHRRVTPFVLGGDHSVTWPAATAVAQEWGDIGVVHFDAHADTADTIDGNHTSHGTPMRRLIESGAVKGRNFVQVGLRGYWPPADVFDWMRDQQMRWHPMQEIWERGIAAVLDDTVNEALDGPGRLYVSVDIDVLDPGFAPGTGTPEPGGMTPVDLLRCVRRLATDTHLVGFDVVELSPPYDHADITVNNAHRLVLEAFAGIAWRQQTASPAPEGDPT